MMSVVRLSMEIEDEDEEEEEQQRQRPEVQARLEWGRLGQESELSLCQSLFPGHKLQDV